MVERIDDLPSEKEYEMAKKYFNTSVEEMWQSLGIGITENTRDAIWEKMKHVMVFLRYKRKAFDPPQAKRIEK